MKYDMTELRPSWVKRIKETRVDGVEVAGDCWLWQGARDKQTGYGRVCVPGQKRSGYAHRVVYEILVGPIEDGLHIDHLCRQRACCNPDHLEPVTCRVNVQRGARATRTHCKQGHPFSGDNLRTWTDSRGYERRVCRECSAKTAYEWRVARKRDALLAAAS